jgi:hypothetical protein
MREEMAETTLREPCREFEEKLVLFASDELDGAERTEVSEHAASCEACARTLEEHRRVLGLWGRVERQEPSAALLASCRAGLVDALDRTEEKNFFARWLEVLLPSGWIALHPAVGGALLVIIGFLAGTMAPRLILRNRVQHLSHLSASQNAPAPMATVSTPAAPKQGVLVTPQTSLSDLDLRSADVTGIQWAPSSDDALPEVQVRLKALRPLLLQGTVDDDEVKNVLTNVLLNNQRFDPEVRLNSIALLKMRHNDRDVCEALCQAARTDEDPAVRMKALEALSGADDIGAVRQTLFDVLSKDSNADVRMEAVDALRAMADNGEIDPEPQALQVLRERAEHDPNNYIRVQSAAIVRDLSQ